MNKKLFLILGLFSVVLVWSVKSFALPSDISMERIFNRVYDSSAHALKVE